MRHSCRWLKTEGSIDSLWFLNIDVVGRNCRLGMMDATNILYLFHKLLLKGRKPGGVFGDEVNSLEISDGDVL